MDDAGTEDAEPLLIVIETFLPAGRPFFFCSAAGADMTSEWVVEGERRAERLQQQHTQQRNKQR